MSTICTLHKIASIDLHKVIEQSPKGVKFLWKNLTKCKSFDAVGIDLDNSWEDLATFFKSKDPVKINVGKIFDTNLKGDDDDKQIGYISPETLEEDLIMISSYPLEEIISTLNHHNHNNHSTDHNAPDHIFTTEEDIDFIATHYRQLYKYFYQASKENCGIVVVLQ